MSVLRRKQLGLAASDGGPPALTLRYASPADDLTVRRLAELDDAPLPPEPLLLAFVGEDLWVAVSLSNFALLADPCRPSGELTFQLLERARQLSPRRHRTVR